MAKIYTKNVWVDEVLVDTPKYQIKDDVGEEVYAEAEIALATDVTVAGTPVNADKMNNIEEGIDGLDDLVDAIGSLTVEEQDAAPSVTGVIKIKFPNGKVTDNGSGVVSVAGGLDNVVEDTTPELGADLELQQFSLKLPTGEPTTNLTAIGIIVTATVDTNAEGIGAPLAMAADGHYDTADADSVDNMPCIALALETGTGAKKILLFGKIRNDAWNWTPGAGAANLLYPSTTVGTLTQTKPSGVDDVVQPVGYVLTDDCIFFNPSMLWITHTG